MARDGEGCGDAEADTVVDFVERGDGGLREGEEKQGDRISMAAASAEILHTISRLSDRKSVV